MQPFPSADLPHEGPQPGTSADSTTDAALSGSIRCVLRDRGFLALHGSDARAFLHSQLSTDVRSMAPGDSTLTSYSDARGRLLLVGRLHARDDGFLLEMPPERLEPVRRQLSKFVLRADVRIEDASDQWSRIGAAGQNAAVCLSEIAGTLPHAAGTGTPAGDGARIVALPGPRPRWQILGPPRAVHAIWSHLAGSTVEAGPAAWRLLDIEAGIPTIREATAGRFVAQMLNLDHLGAIDFDKGCYPGQEVIARTHYLGRVKRRMQILGAPALGEPPAPMAPLHAGERVVGEVIDAAADADNTSLLLAVVRADAGPSVAVGAGDGAAAEFRPLPYSIDNAAA